MIPVTRPFLPPENEYFEKISSIWKTNWLTNSGPLSIELEECLKKHLNVSNLLFVTNGTIALQLALKSLEVKGEVITTPFSFVATSSSIVWENCIPVYVDIDKDTLNIDTSKIEEAITTKTSAILATHVYGNPCDVVKIEEIAKKHNLKVIYDGAHAFGVKINGKSIFKYGDISICSTHATKSFHTTEGGFIVTNDAHQHERMELMRNFGFKDSTSFSFLGINAKNSEFHAAMGLVNLNYIDNVFNQRSLLSSLYDELLVKYFKKPVWSKTANVICSYYPIIFENEEDLVFCNNFLVEKGVIARRYFYPSLSKSLPYVDSCELPIVDSVSSRVLCLPLYYELTIKEVTMISDLLNEAIAIKNISVK